MTGQAELPHMPRRPDPVPEISEKELQNGIVQVAKILGYHVMHTRSVPVKRGKRVVWQAPLQGHPGFPDLCIVGNGRVLFRELKVGRNVLSAEQAGWIRELELAGADVSVWTGEQWFAGLVEAELRRGTRHEKAEAA